MTSGSNILKNKKGSDSFIKTNKVYIVISLVISLLIGGTLVIYLLYSSSNVSSPASASTIGTSSGSSSHTTEKAKLDYSVVIKTEAATAAFIDLEEGKARLVVATEKTHKANLAVDAAEEEEIGSIIFSTTLNRIWLYFILMLRLPRIKTR